METLKKTIDFYFQKLLSIVNKTLDSLIAVIDSALNNIVKTVDVLLSKIPALIEAAFNTAVANANTESLVVILLCAILYINSAVIIANPIWSLPILGALVLIIKK